MVVGRAFMLCLRAALILAAGPAFAHTENGEGYSTITGEAGTIRYALYLDYFELGRVVDLGAARGASTTELDARLAERLAAVGDHLLPRLHVSLDGAPCEGRAGGGSVVPIADRPFARIDIRFECPGRAAGAFLVRYDVFFDDNDPLHRNVATYDLGGARGQLVFTAAERDLLSGTGTLTAQATRFIQLGVHHILIGLDHLLFIVALLIGARTLRQVLAVATAFTLAHSVTLALTALGWLRLPGSLVEPLIALSIAYVAVDNVLPSTPRARLLVVFGFGLLHGAGFAGALRLTGDGSLRTLLSILSFNTGVEIGQLMIVLAVFPVLVLVRRLRWSAAMQGAATAGVGGIGLVWFIRRLFE